MKSIAFIPLILSIADLVGVTPAELAVQLLAPRRKARRAKKTRKTRKARKEAAAK